MKGPIQFLILLVAIGVISGAIPGWLQGMNGKGKPKSAAPAPSNSLLASPQATVNTSAQAEPSTAPAPAPSAQAEPAAAPGGATIAASATIPFVFSRPNFEAARLGILSAGTPVRILDRRPGWVLIMVGDSTGWIPENQVMGGGQ